MLWLVGVVLYVLEASADSTAVGTSAIVTTYESTYYSTTSSIISTSTSTKSTGVSCETTTNSAGSPVTQCISGISITAVPVYGSNVITLTTKITSTIGYSTIYSSISDGSTPAPSPSPTPSVTSLSTASQISQISRITTDGTTITTIVGPSTTSGLRSPAEPSSTDQSSSSSSSSNSSSPRSSGLSTGLKAAIAVAVIFGVGFGACLAVFLVKRHQKIKADKSSTLEEDRNVGAALGKAELAGQEAMSSSGGSAIAKEDVLVVAGEIPVTATQGHHHVAAIGPHSNTRYYEAPPGHLHEMQDAGRLEAHGEQTHEAHGEQVHEAHGEQVHEAHGELVHEAHGEQMHEAEGEQVHKAHGDQRHEAPNQQGNEARGPPGRGAYPSPQYEVMRRATPVHELEGTPKTFEIHR